MPNNCWASSQTDEKSSTKILCLRSLRSLSYISTFGQVALIVFPSGTSSVVFRLTNDTTNTIRLPSAGYVSLDSYICINKNPAYAISHRPEIDVDSGLPATGGKLEQIGCLLRTILGKNV
jgi:hypothetical protein